MDTNSKTNPFLNNEKMYPGENKMRSKLLDAMEVKNARTHNGALTHSTTSNRVVDLFSVINALRGRSEEEINTL